ncbi:hypothetical protein ATJ93_1224 [Halopiger aswanensis]|uniref:Uncharacterized protein n=2 Tax=Halopiger aswanensis TaxID=148449 RepID=A0A3R7I066_9EURY|nr:hypothetical protein ATJ93_1224 [Halopiger aswanensis]
MKSGPYPPRAPPITSYDCMSRDYVDELRWGWQCPRCDADATVTKDPRTETFLWACPEESCPAVGFGFTSRRKARIALREYRERYNDIYR